MREKNKGRKKELLASVQAFIPVKDIRGRRYRNDGLSVYPYSGD